MSAFRALRGVVLVGCLASVLLAVVVSGAFAAGTKVCVPSAAETAIVTPPSSGTCKTGYTETTLLPKAEQHTLEQILPDIVYVEKGVGGKPTIQFSGVNVQVINGSGSESDITGTGKGTGNLIVGYDPSPGTQTGSHDLVVGGIGNAYTSYGGIIVGGHNNTLTGPYASILGGAENIASGNSSTVVGGH